MNREYYTDAEWQSKATRHRRGTAFLSKVRKLLGLTPATARVWSNKGGPAVDGEVMLHTETCFVSISPHFSYARKACLSIGDYGCRVGSRNMQIPTAALATPAALAAWLKGAGLQ